MDEVGDGFQFLSWRMELTQDDGRWKLEACACGGEEPQPAGG